MDRMPGVVAALCANHDVGLFGQHVNDFAFAFIAPLGAYQYCSCHKRISCALTPKNPETNPSGHKRAYYGQNLAPGQNVVKTKTIARGFEAFLMNRQNNPHRIGPARYSNCLLKCNDRYIKESKCLRVLYTKETKETKNLVIRLSAPCLI
jgi:hypothetical protein